MDRKVIYSGDSLIATCDGKMLLISRLKDYSLFQRGTGCPTENPLCLNCKFNKNKKKEVIQNGLN